MNRFLEVMRAPGSVLGFALLVFFSFPAAHAEAEELVAPTSLDSLLQSDTWIQTGKYRYKQFALNGPQNTNSAEVTVDLLGSGHGEGISLSGAVDGLLANDAATRRGVEISFVVERLGGPTIGGARIEIDSQMHGTGYVAASAVYQDGRLNPVSAILGGAASLVTGAGGTDVQGDGSGYETLLGATNEVKVFAGFAAEIVSAGSIVDVRSVDYRFLDDELLLDGDYNLDGTVDAGDYEIWYDNFGATPGLRAVSITPDGDGNSDGVVDSADYTIWRDNLGASTTAAFSSLTAPAHAIPEPNSLAICLGLGLWMGIPARSSNNRTPSTEVAALPIYLTVAQKSF